MQHHLGFKGGVLTSRLIVPAFPAARRAVNKALELDDTNCEAHVNLARLSWQYDWNWEVAETSYRRAVELWNTKKLSKCLKATRIPPPPWRTLTRGRVKEEKRWKFFENGYVNLRTNMSRRT